MVHVEARLVKFLLLIEKRELREREIDRVRERERILLEHVLVHVNIELDQINPFLHPEMCNCACWSTFG